MRRRLSPARVAVALVTVALVTVAFVTGCAAGPGGEPQPTVLPQSGAAPTTTSAEPAGESRALELIGLWRVSGAAGESDETWLRLAGGEFQLLRECGMIGGSWNAGVRAFLTSVYMASGECVDPTTHQMPAVPWLASATAYEPTEAGWRLTDDSGATMASLAIDGAPVQFGGSRGLERLRQSGNLPERRPSRIVDHRRLDVRLGGDVDRLGRSIDRERRHGRP